MSKKVKKWVPASRVFFSTTKPPVTWWYCVPEGSKQEGVLGVYKVTCGRAHTSQRGAEIHCKRLNEGKDAPICD